MGDVFGYKIVVLLWLWVVQKLTLIVVDVGGALFKEKLSVIIVDRSSI